MRDFLKKVAAFAKNNPVMTSSLALATFAVMIGASAWGPERQMFTIESPAPYITFNSISNNPVIGGSEADFVGIREKGSTGAWTNEMKVEAGKEYQVRMYVHNDASENLNLVAENVLAKINLPTTTGKSVTVSGAISASNAKPTQVYDSATFVADQDFNMAYVAGSAIYENGVFTNGVSLPDSIMTSAGASLGYDKMDGKIPGCMKYSGVVVITVKPQFATQPEEPSKIEISKTVRKIGGEKEWNETVDAVAGDTVEFQIDAKNAGNSTINNLVIRDVLPAGLEYIAGSAKLYNANNNFAGEAISDNVVGQNGANVGAYTAGSNAIVRLRAKVATDKCGVSTLTNLAQASNQQVVVNDTASVKVNKTCETEMPTVNYSQSCQSLTAKLVKTEENTVVYEFNTSYKVSNTTFKGIQYIVKNSKGEIVADKTVNGGTKLQISLPRANEKYSVVAYLITSDDKTTEKNCETTFETTAKPVVAVSICNNIQVVKISRTKFEITVNYTSTNNNVTNINLVIVDANGNQIQQHTAKDGKFVIEINQTGKYTISANVNGNNNSKCTKEIVVEEEQKVAEKPSITINKTVNGVKNLVTVENTDFNYEITVRNNGNVDLKDVKVTDETPANIKFISTDKGEIKNGVMTYTIPTLKVGESQTITIKAQALTTGRMKNVACVDTPTIAGEKDGCDSASVEVPAKETPAAKPTVKTTTTPSVPAELPRTGATAMAIVAMTSLTTAIVSYVVSFKK